jgi:hypothetical protein
MLKKGQPKHEARMKSASGFDYPATLVGTSQWLGSDGKPVTVYYDPATGASGLSIAQYVLSKIDDVMASCDAWFGVKGAGGNIIIASIGGGAYHYGCDFATGGDWYLDPADGNETTLGLAMAEVCESYMGLTNAGWNCGGSGGEALSRFLAEVATGGASGAMVGYSAASSYDGNDWISKDQGTDGDYPSIGCGVLYLWWLVSLGYSVQKIVQDGEPDGTLASNYNIGTGNPASQAFFNFTEALAPLGSPANFVDDNPFKAPNPAYPAGGVTPPPPPPVTGVIGSGTLLDGTAFNMVETPTSQINKALKVIMARKDVRASVSKATAAKITFWQILTVILPYIFQLIEGKPVDWMALITAIEALFNPPPAIKGIEIVRNPPTTH